MQMLSEMLKLHMHVHNCEIFIQDPGHHYKVAEKFLDKQLQRATRVDWKQSRYLFYRKFVKQNEK